MPNDFTLMPGIPGPAERQVQRTAALEARMAAIESKRDPVFTTFSLALGQTKDFVWTGGRLWGMSGGWASWTTPSAAGNYVLGASLNFDGMAATPFAQVANAYTPAANSPLQVALPMGASEFSVANMAGLYGLHPGNTITLSVSLAGNATNARVSGMFVEWPQS